MQVYLDNAATTRVCPEAAEAALRVMTECYGNPSSAHSMGRQASKILEEARAHVASALEATSEEIFFTSGGTESINWALLSATHLQRRQGSHIISSAVEHSAVLESLKLLEKRGFEVTRLAPQKDGSISPESVREALREDTILVSLMMVNNETGGITDIPAVSRALKDCGSTALLHTDAIQGFLKIPFSAKAPGPDLISLSGHKIHAPKGVGALYIRGGARAIRLEPLIKGGRQESEMRAGTEALPLIAAFGEAARVGKNSFEESSLHISNMKGLMSELLLEGIPELRILSGEAPHILSVSLPNYMGDNLKNLLDSKGFLVSRSSACKKGGRSHVLDAMKLPPAVADGALRIGLSRYTSEEEVRAFCLALEASAREIMPRLH